MYGRFGYIKLLRRFTDGAFVLNYIVRELKNSLLDICLCQDRQASLPHHIYMRGKELLFDFYFTISSESEDAKE